MRRFPVRGLLALGLVSLALSAPAEAGDGALSISLSTGVRPDMAGLGSTIMQDGSIDTAETTMANAVYGTGQALMSDRDNMTLGHNSGATDVPFNMLDDYQTGGSMLGLELGGDVRYELDAVIDFPLYLELGFYYSKRIVGGAQSRTLGDVATENGELAMLLALNGEDANEYVGGTMETTWDARWIEIPLALGIKVPVSKQQTFAYGSVGVSWFSGGFSVGLDVDEAYANVLNTHLDAETLTVTNLSPGAVRDTVRFDGTAVGLNYGVGVQTGFGKGLALFIELNSSGAGSTVFCGPMKPETKQLLTGLSSQRLAEADDAWFDKLAYPVVFGGATMRIGLRYYLF